MTAADWAGATAPATTATERPPAPRRARRVGLTAALALVLAGLLSACDSSGSDRYLAALRADPMSSYAPDGAEPDFTSERGHETSSSSGKGQQAQVLRVFELGQQERVLADIEAAAAEAAGHGWSEESRTETAAVLTRAGPDGQPMRLTLATSQTEPTTLTITLVAG